MRRFKIFNHTMLFILSLICLICISSCESKEEKQETAIRGYMNKSYTDYSKFDCVETHYLDSVQDNPVDYECLTLGLKAYRTLLGISQPALELVKCYTSENNLGEGRFSFSTQSLTGISKQKYFEWLDSVRNFAIAKNELVRKVDNYQPHPYTRVFKKYRISSDGKNDFLVARFYFDDALNLINQLVISEEENNCALGMINMATNHDFSEVDKLFSRLVELPGDEVLNFLAQNPDVPIKDLAEMSMSCSSETTDKESASSVLQGETPSQERNNQDYLSSYETNEDIYVVTTRCAGAISKEAEKRFTEFAAKGNTDAISEMLLRGDLIPVSAGERVLMLDLGFTISKVRTSRGHIVFVDTEYLRKQ